MTNETLGKDIYFYYRRGICVAKFRFYNSTITFQARDLSTDKWSEWSPYVGDDNFMSPEYTMPLSTIANLISQLEEVDWTGSQVALDNIVFRRSVEIEDNDGKGRKKEATIWVQLGDDVNLFDLVVCENEVVGFIKPSSWEISFLIRPGYENLTPLRLWEDEMLSKPGRGVAKLDTFMIPMRDGIRLATDVYLPADYCKDEKLPTILMRTPYNRKEFCRYDQIYADRGYAVVAQDMRGKDDSEGEFMQVFSDKEDGSDTVDWIALQSWSNGSVGTIGGSHEGYMQWAIASSGNPHLKAMVNLCGNGSAWRDPLRRGGAICQSTLKVIAQKAKQTMDWDILNTIDWEAVYNTRPLAEIPLKMLGKEDKLWSDFVRHVDYDEFWEKADVSMNPENIRVPALVISGWYDVSINGVVEMWDLMREHNSENRRIMMGPWMHFLNDRRQLESFDLGNDSLRYDFDLLHLKWFDRFLKGIKNGVDEIKAEYYITGLNQWRTSSEWPPVESKDTFFYLQNRRNYNDSENVGILNDNAGAISGYDEYVYDPQNPVPHIARDHVLVCSPHDYSELEKRADMLVYTSEPFPNSCAITGGVDVFLYASTSARDTDWCLRLTIVKPDGQSFRLSDNLIRARYRHSFYEPELLVPEQIEEYQIKLPYIGQSFEVGDRLRLQVMSSMEGLIFPNSNTGENPYTDMKFEIAEQKIYYGPNFPSRIHLHMMQL